MSGGDVAASEDRDFSFVVMTRRQLFHNAYLQCLGLSSLGDDKLAKRLLKSPDLVAWSSKLRIQTLIRNMKYDFAMSKSDVITICFKVIMGDKYCIYAFLYGRCVKKGKKYELCPEFCCTSPSLKSQDGEYRKRFVPFEYFEKYYKLWTQIRPDIEKYISNLLASRQISFHIGIFRPTDCHIPIETVKEYIDSKHLDIQLFISAWLCGIVSEVFGILPNHTNDAYKFIINQITDDDIRKELNQESMLELIHYIGHYSVYLPPKKFNLRDLMCGQKIIPMTIIEAMRPDDINFNVWREIYINNMASNLVLNFICPSFPIINNWFYIQNAPRELFDNAAMHEKYNQSEIATIISIQMRELDKLNYIDKERAKGPIDNRFYRLSRYMHKSIVYADSNIRLTDLTMCITIEDVGDTVRDAPSTIVNLYAKEVGHPLTDIDMFTKNMFEFVYAFYCMNVKTGIIHGDLHLNNCTFNYLFEMYHPNTRRPLVKNPSIVYIVGKELYVFKQSGVYSMIIDFSRAIIGNYVHIEYEFSTRYAEMFFKEQAGRFIRMIFVTFPKVIEQYGDVIEELVTNKFPIMFKIFTAVDTYVIANGVTGLFATDDVFRKGLATVPPGAIRLLMKLSNRAEELVMNHMEDLVKGRINSADDIEWPNLVILREAFRDNLFTPEQLMANDDINIVDIFNSNNDVIYDIEDYDTWGPLLKLDIDEKIREEYGVEFTLPQWDKIRQIDESTPLEELTRKYEALEKDILTFEPWMVA